MIDETQDNNWPLLEWGVLGLSPKGSFFTYLLDLYDDSLSVSFALKHSVINSNVGTSSLAFKLDAYLNPIVSKHYSIKDALGPFQRESKTKWWVLNGSVSLDDSELSYQNKKICLDSFTNGFFGVVEALVWCQRIRNKVCLSSKKCSRINATLENAPKINLIIEGHDLSISPEEYIYFDNEGMQCRIGDTPASLEHQTCPPGTQVVLGKLFFQKYTPIFTVTKTRAYITLTSKFKVPQTKNVIWIIFGSLMVLVIIVGVAYAVIQGKIKKDSHDEYQEI